MASGPSAGELPKFWLTYSCNHGAQRAVPGTLPGTSLQLLSGEGFYLFINFPSAEHLRRSQHISCEHLSQLQFICTALFILHVETRGGLDLWVGLFSLISPPPPTLVSSQTSGFCPSAMGWALLSSCSACAQWPQVGCLNSAPIFWMLFIFLTVSAIHIHGVIISWHPLI